jgi:hypothetical protein
LPFSPTLTHSHRWSRTHPFMFTLYLPALHYSTTPPSPSSSTALPCSLSPLSVHSIHIQRLRHSFLFMQMSCEPSLSVLVETIVTLKQHVEKKAFSRTSQNQIVSPYRYVNK